MKNVLPIAVSLPATVASVEDGSLLREITRVGTTRAKCIEFRIDKEIGAMDPPSVTPAVQEMLDTLVYECEKAQLESIFTCRVASEGGSFQPSNDDVHGAIIEAMVAARPCFVDVELATGVAPLARAIDACNAHFVTPIFSHHDAFGTPAIQDLAAILSTLTGKLESMRDIDRERAILKIVFTATRAEDNVIPLKVIDLLDMDDWVCISFCMGPLGWLSRVACVLPRKGQGKTSAFTYASLFESLAPGQLPLDLMESILAHFS